MSIRAVVWALDQNCPSPTSKLVLITLASFLNPDGECWPSQARIAADCGITRQSVNAQIKLLETHGFLENKTRIDSKGQQTSLYFLRCQPNGHPLSTDLTAMGVNENDTEPKKEEDLEKKEEEPSLREGHARAHEATPRPERSHGKQGRQLEIDWQPTAADRLFAQKRGFDPDAIADAFRDHWHAEKGPKTFKRDWDAAFRTWVRRERPPFAQQSFGFQRPSPNGSNPPSFVAAIRRAFPDVA